MSASCKGGPSLKPNVDSYEEAKKLMSVERVRRRGVFGFGKDEEAWDAWESRREAWIDFVTIAVWVTLMGTIVFLTGTFRTICAASAGIEKVRQTDG